MFHCCYAWDNHWGKPPCPPLSPFSWQNRILQQPMQWCPAPDGLVNGGIQIQIISVLELSWAGAGRKEEVGAFPKSCLCSFLCHQHGTKGQLPHTRVVATSSWSNGVAVAAALFSTLLKIQCLGWLPLLYCPSYITATYHQTGKGQPRQMEAYNLSHTSCGTILAG